MSHLPPVSLLVESRDDVGALLEGALRAKGYEVLTALSAMEGFAILETVEIDLLITDGIMPGLDGLELARLAHGEWPELSILIISGSGPMDRVLLHSPRVGFLSKPFALDQFNEAVRASLRPPADTPELEHGHPESLPEGEAPS